MYPQIERYLASYPEQHGGQLLSLNETVQDVTNDYIDSQSRLSNLRNEQQRLQGILDHTQTLSDVLTVEQQLTTVEGQIEDIEAHLNALSGQTTFYTVVMNLSPLSPAPAVPQPSRSAQFNPGQTLHDAWGVALLIGEGIVTGLIWLGVFGIFLVPLAVTGWLIWRRTVRTRAVRAAV